MVHPAEAAQSRRRLVAVILNYCTPGLVVDAAESVLPQLEPGEDLLVLVDNASPDGSRAELSAYAARHPEMVRFVQAGRNGGFAAGNNVGMRAVDAQAYFLLNSDTVVRPGAVRALLDRLGSAADIGLVSPRLVWPDGTCQISCFRLHTPVSELIAGAQSGPITRLLRGYDVPLGVLDEATDVEWTSFAAVVVRAEVLRQVGTMDESFFMYFEDADYCRSVRQHGFRVVHEPLASVVHLRGKSSPVKEATRLRKRRPKYYYDSRRRYFEKSMGPAGPFLANACWTVGRCISWLRERAGNKQPHTVDCELRDNWGL
jgi:GT2 family glycosyltransferase